MWKYCQQEHLTSCTAFFPTFLKENCLKGKWGLVRANGEGNVFQDEVKRVKETSWETVRIIQNDGLS